MPPEDAPPRAAAAQPSSISAPPRLGGYVQARETYAHGSKLTGTLNRARLSVDGALPSRFSYRVSVELEAPAGRTTPSAPSLCEANVRWSPGAFALTTGQFKTPFSREYLLPIPLLETADFAGVVDSLAPKYDLGVMGEYNPRPWLSVATGAARRRARKSFRPSIGCVTSGAGAGSRAAVPDTGAGAALALVAVRAIEGLACELRRWTLPPG